jgi:NAD(P)-dependent dehydrogenase (short-subunit alcohol dehydrogenase family)
MSSKLLLDKVALVTGGASGIGRETALLMASEGARVAVCDRDATNGPKVVAEIEACGGQAMFCAADVADSEQVQAAVAAVVARFGRIDCAFNNAGIEGDFCQTADYDEADFARVFAINVTGVFLCMKYELREMLRTGGGTIVNTASITGLIGWRGAPAYSASKHAVVGLTQTAALEYARKGIRINAVCPGVITTPMGERVASENPASRDKLVALHPMHRLGTPSEVAKAVLWLSSDASSFTTGHALTVDGGLVVR